ncbi:hypothetical protein D7X33_00750 [Butyricicoccus sp. 1XD8-22]|nr:hypothetical protein D7X33_00750 [Butyricicoccus sp. 1XD8-22]
MKKKYLQSDFAGKNYAAMYLLGLLTLRKQFVPGSDVPVAVLSERKRNGSETVSYTQEIRN